MFEKTEVNISNSKKPSIVIIHKISFPTISIKLEDANYHVWSQIMQMPIVDRRKKGCITGRKVVLTDNDLNYDEWKVEDVSVKSWLINSMTDKMMAHFV